MHYFIKHLSEPWAVSRVIKDAGRGQQKLKKKACSPSVVCTPSNCMMYFSSKNFPKLSNTHLRVFFICSTAQTHLEWVLKLELHGNKKWPYAGGSEYEKGARMSWHYGSRVFCCTGWDSGGPETAMEGHSESQFPLHHFSSQCWAPSTWIRIPFSYFTTLPSMTKAKYHSETSAQMN